MYRSRVFWVLLSGVILVIILYSLKLNVASNTSFPPVSLNKPSKKCDTRITRYPVVFVVDGHYEVAGASLGMKLDQVYTIWGRPDTEEDPEEFSDYYARYGTTTLLYDNKREVLKISFSIRQEGFTSKWFHDLGKPTEIKDDIEYYELKESRQLLKIDKKNGYGYLITSEKKY